MTPLNSCSLQTDLPSSFRADDVIDGKWIIIRRTIRHFVVSHQSLHATGETNTAYHACYYQAFSDQMWSDRVKQDCLQCLHAIRTCTLHSITASPAALNEHLIYEHDWYKLRRVLLRIKTLLLKHNAVPVKAKWHIDAYRKIQLVIKLHVTAR